MPTDWQHDHYAVLGVQPEIGFAELRRVWRRLARRWHPDYAGPAATATFQNISAAYEVLSDPVARAAYDQRRGTRQSRSAASPTGTVPRRKAPGVALQRLCGPLNSLVACGVARRVGNDVIEIFPSAREAATGGMVTISLRVPIRCPTCAGDALASCNRCANSRTVEELFSAWLALPPGVTDGTILTPSAVLPGMLRPITFRVRLRPRATPK
ncbi:MAG TPA: DnaJ domain-containing protein [Candidatus Limnocylindrales bacterium]|nr:DnaJ domain-containing protein [Candidatus Limnocylindrales bacterium]